MDIETKRLFLNHLRSIHFAILLSSGAVFIVLIGSDRLYSSATEELNDVLALEEIYSQESVYQSVQDLASKRMENSDFSLHSEVEKRFNEILKSRFSVAAGISIDGLGWSRLEPDVELEEIWVSRKQTKFGEYTRSKMFDYWILERGYLLLADNDPIGDLSDWPGVETYSVAGLLSSLDTMLSNDQFDEFMTADGDFAVQSYRIQENGVRTEIEGSLVTAELNVHLESGRRFVGTIGDVVPLGTNDGPRIGLLKIPSINHQRLGAGAGQLLLSLGESVDPVILQIQVYTTETPHIGYSFDLPVVFRRSDWRFHEVHLGAEFEHNRYLGRYKTENSASNVFPSLFETAKNLGSTSTEDFEDHLAQLQKSGLGQIEIVGLKVPNRIVETWGIALVLALQAYLLIYLRKYRTLKARPDLEPFPWVGLYSDCLSLIVFRLSLTLPAVVIVMVLGNAASLLEADMQHMVMFGVAVLLLFLIRREHDEILN